MKTSNELTRQHLCSKYRSDIALSHYNPAQILQDSQIELVERLLQGEEIEHLELELNRILQSKGYHFEDTIQQNMKLFLMCRDIKRYVTSDIRNNKQFVEDTDKIVNMFGEDIQVEPSFFYVENGYLSVVKVKADTPTQTFTETSGKRVKIDERENYESYALMLLARKLRDKYYPECSCRIEINHLKDDYNPLQKGQAYNEDFFAEDSLKTTEVFDGFYYDKLFEELHEIDTEYPETCDGASCSGCGCYNACHYTELPLAVDMEDLMKNPDDINLSYAQRQVMNHNTGSLLVDSGAGAGKTTCITMRLLELLRNGTDPKDICLLTFTNVAAEEMIDRVGMYTRSILNDPEKAGQLPPDLDISDITATTFNGLCQKVIDEHYEELGFEKKPRVVPDEIEQSLIHEVFNRYPDRIPGWNYNRETKSIYDKSLHMPWGTKSAADEFLEVVYQIKMAESDIDNPEGDSFIKYKWDYIDNLELDNKYKTQLKMMVEEYNLAHTNRINGMENSGKAYITFLDQFLLVDKLFKQNPLLWDEYGFKHIIVDEVQDSNTMQLELLRKIQNNSNYQSLCSVGDMQQSIYGFNNAEPDNIRIDKYSEFFGPTETVAIRENYRCSRAVIGFTNNMIDKNILDIQAKRISFAENEFEHLIGTREKEGHVNVEGFYTKDLQYEWIADEIEKDLEKGVIPGDIMFLGRTKAELQLLASKLTKRNIPCVLRCPLPYIDNSNVGSGLAFIDSYLYGYEEGYFDYLNQLEKGQLFYADAEDIKEKVNAFKTEIEGKSRDLETLMEYLNGLDVEKRDECYQSFLENFAHASDLNEMELKVQAFKRYGTKSSFKREANYSEVSLSTIHSAKGLESKVVYCDIAKLDKPEYHEKRLSPKNAKEYKEDNRLEYVTYTRAKDKLVVTAPYVLRAGRSHQPILNKRLINAYRAINKTYGYNYMAYVQAKAEEKAMEVQSFIDEAKTYVVPTFEAMFEKYRDYIPNQMDYEEYMEDFSMEEENDSDSERESYVSFTEEDLETALENELDELS